MSDQVLTTVSGPVARVTFNRPEVRNAVNHEMLATIREFLKRIELDTSVRCIVLAGAGEHFMAGADVGGFKEALNSPKEQRRRDFESRIQGAAPLFVALARMPQPVVASVRGAVAGAALGFVAGADFALCGDELDLRPGARADRRVSGRIELVLPAESARRAQGEGACDSR